MTLIRPIETEAGARDAFTTTENLFQRSVTEMERLIDQLEAGDAPSEAEIKKTITALVNSANTTMKERDRVLEQRKRSAGIVGEYAIDVTAAKLEIGRKLDLLRDADRTRSVSG